MGKQSAKHYVWDDRRMGEQSALIHLGLWQFRLRMVENGLIHPSDDLVLAGKQLVSRLANVESDTKIKLEVKDGIASYKIAETGVWLADIKFVDFEWILKK